MHYNVSGKPGSKKEGGPKADFCSLKTVDDEIIADLFFDISDFKEVKIIYTVQIYSIEIPREITDPKETREKSIRKGKIIRKIAVDGFQKIEEKVFEV